MQFLVHFFIKIQDAGNLYNFPYVPDTVHLPDEIPYDTARDMSVYLLIQPNNYRHIFYYILYVYYSLPFQVKIK